MSKKQFPEITTPFINILSDYGFKRTFGSRKYQKNVVRLLEATLGDEIDITKIVPFDSDDDPEEAVHDDNGEVVQYHDKEVLPPDEDGKKIMYDVYFTIKAGKEGSSFKRRHLLKGNSNKDVEHHFILEMQNVYNAPFEDRMAYYLAKMVATQGKAGWNYDLDPVILIGITDFDFPHLTKQLVQDFELREKTTGESLTKKLRMLFHSLNKVPEEWEKCETDLQRQLFIIKYMDTMDKNSKPYKDGRYSELFDAAESSHVVGEEAVLYSQSLTNLRNLKANFEYRFEEGRAEGRAEGRVEGIMEGTVRTARNLKSLGASVEMIVAATGLSQSEVEAL